MRRRWWWLSAGAVLVMILTLGGYYWIIQSHPQLDGEIRSKGVNTRVEIFRDSYGVPHIYADNVHDLFFGQGYVMAQDRLWQMDLLRRMGTGRLSEIVGDKGLSMDIFARTLGIETAAEQDWIAASVETRAVLTAFSAGVNAYMNASETTHPLECRLLRYRPEPWDPLASLVIGKVVSLILARNAVTEIVRSRLAERIGADAGRELLSPWDLDIRGSVIGKAGQGWNPFCGGVGGSNNWVVDGTRSETGWPLLANDPHLGVFVPSIWYENHLEGSPYRVTGVSFPGTPGVVIGHNGTIAWGITNMEADVQDLYLEDLHPRDRNRSRYKGAWEPLVIRREEIKIRGSDPLPLVVRRSRHGPLLDGAVDGVTTPLALRCICLDAPSDNLRAFLSINTAHNWEEFREALRAYQGPPQNFIYADARGNIGYWGAGRVPRRPFPFGLYPVAGSDGDYEWQGYLSLEELPHVYNPSEHWIATANNRPVNDAYPYYIGCEWAPPFRYRRIVDMLQETAEHSIASFQDMQADVLSLPARHLTPYLGDVSAADPRVAEAQRYLRDWDHRLTADSVPAALYETILRHLTANTFEDELGELYTPYLQMRIGLLNSPHHRGVELLLKIVDDPFSRWFDDIRTDPWETRDEIIRKSMRDAVEELSQRLGPDMAAWSWGRLHRCGFRHPLGSIWPLAYLFNPPEVPLAGDKYSVAHAGFDMSDAFSVTTIASYRQIIDLHDLSRSRAVHPPGQSGHVLHPHYDDLLPLWAEGSGHPLYFDREDVEAHAVHRLVLTREK